MDRQDFDVVSLTADLVAAYVSNNSVPSDQLPGIIGSVHQSLSDLVSGDKPSQPEPQKPAVPVKKSVTPDFIISLEDGKKFKSLKRHLATQYGMTPTEYRAKWKLPADYPMVAPNYAATRSALAKELGLGKKAQAAPAEPATEKLRGQGRKRDAAPAAPAAARPGARKKAAG